MATSQLDDIGQRALTLLHDNYDAASVKDVIVALQYLENKQLMEITSLLRQANANGRRGVREKVMTGVRDGGPWAITLSLLGLLIQRGL